MNDELSAEALHPGLNPRTEVRALPRPVQLCLLILLAGALVIWGSPGLSLAAGLLFALTVGHPHSALGNRISKALFQGCVVLLGFGMDLQKVLHAGMNGLLSAAVSITATLALGFFLGRLLGIEKKISALIASGTAICGGSAIAAVGPAISASEAEMGIAVGTVFLLNAVALYLFPMLGGALHLTQHQFGLWAGIGIHDISSVVGAASVYGHEALQTATAVKLSRALWIVPVTLAMSALFARKHRATRPHSGKHPRVAVPWFIGLFLLASIARSVIPGVSSLSVPAHAVAKAGMTVALCLIGASISPRALKNLGWKAAVQAVALWIFISAVALGLALTLG